MSSSSTASAAAPVPLPLCVWFRIQTDATSVWNGGNAHCVGYLYSVTNVGGGNTQQLASLGFDATG